MTLAGLTAGVVVDAHPRARSSLCRQCGRVSMRVHSRYRRGLADRPVSGQPVTVRLTVRRFFCGHPDCSTRTFVEQLPGLTERYARRTTDLREALAAVALALAGRAGSRLAAALGMGVSRSTLLRLIRALPDPPVGQVEVLGVDEFARRRRRDYGTVLVDLGDGNRPVDMYDGQKGVDFADWLRARVCEWSVETKPAATPTAPAPAPRMQSRSPIGGIYGTDSASTWKSW